MRVTRTLPFLAILVLVLASVLFSGPPAAAQESDSEGPSFDSPTYEREIAGHTPAGYRVGSRVRATGGEGDVIHTLSGADAVYFSISVSGQIRTLCGVTYDPDIKSSYSVTVTATDENAATATAAVTITVTNAAPPVPPMRGGRVHVGLAQVGLGVTGTLLDGNWCVDNEDWQWQRSATESGAYSDIPASEGGTSNPYMVPAGDLGMWLRAKVTYDDVSGTGQTAEGTALQPVLWKPALSNVGVIDPNGLYYSHSAPTVHLFAQPFTTGTDPRGYQMRAARLTLDIDDTHIEDEGTASGTWGVHADDAGKPAAAPLSGTAPILDADVPREYDVFGEYAHPGGVYLEPDTRYWLVISQTSPADEGLLSVGAWGEDDGTDILGNTDFPLDTPSQDPGSAAGWSVDFEMLHYYWNDPDTTVDDNPDSALLPWHPARIGLQRGAGRFVMRMSLLVAPDVTVEFGETDYTADEGGTATVEVTLSADPRRTLTVPITATGQGGATSTDFAPPPSVTFNAGETSKTFEFAIIDDEVDDDDETVKLGFGTMPDAWITTGTQDEATVAIVDDDDPVVTVSFGQSSYTVAESDVAGTTDATENAVEVTVTLSADPERQLVIPIVATDQGGATSADYSGVPSDVTFNSGETSQSFTFTATHDTVDDDDESVLLEFGNMPDERVSPGLHAEATVEIDDDDHPPVTVEYGQATQLVGEGETVNVTIRLSADPERMVTIPITATGQENATSADFNVPASVTFNTGEMETTIPFMAVDDEVDDDDEWVKLEFGTPLPDRVTLGTRTETRLDINDDDPPEVTVMFAQSAYTVAEGATQQVTVSVDKDPERTIIIPITAALQGTASGADYSGVVASVTFTSGGSLSQSFTFEATQDRIDDDNEGVKLGFGTMPDTHVTAGTPNELTLNIADDDTAEVVLVLTSLTVGEEESAGYTVALATEPTVDVTVTVTGHSGTDLSLESGRLVNDVLTFTPVNWSSPQPVTVRAAHDDDGVRDDETLTHTAAGAEYDNVSKDLPVTVNDNDPLGIVLSLPSLTVAESASADYAVSLATEPTVAVTVAVTGHAGTDLSLIGDMLTFTSADWDTPQPVTVSATHDDDWEDDVEVLIHTARGGEYDTLEPVELPVTVDDNTGDLRLVDGTLTTEDGEPCEGRLEIYYDGQWGTICDDYWTEEDADVACRALGFSGGSVDDWNRFRNSFFPPGEDAQPIWLDDMLCGGGESNLLDCRRGSAEVGKNNCQHFEDVGLRCLKNSGPYVVNVEFSPPGAQDGNYVPRETVEVTLVWSEPVTITTTLNGFPRLWLSYGGLGGKWLYRPVGSGTDRMVYTHTLSDPAGASSFPYLAVGSDSLILVNPSADTPTVGTIVSVETGNAAVVGLRNYLSNEPDATTTGSSQQVEATTTDGVPSFNEPGADGVFSTGETVEVRFRFSRAVNVDTADGTPSVQVLLSGTTSREAEYLRGSGTQQLVFGYTLRDGDGEHGSLLLEPNTLALNGGSIEDTSGNSADITHQGTGVVFAPPPDVDAPGLRSATVDGSNMALAYDEELDNSGLPSSGLFSVNVNGTPRSVLIVAVRESTVQLHLSAPVGAGDSVTVSYTAPTDDGAARVQDTSGNDAESFSGQVVSNNTAPSQTLGGNGTRNEPQEEPNSPASGEPTISGTAQVGETLTANTSDITDADGLINISYAYQWLADGLDISGANAASYTLTPTEEGKAIKVRVSFTDDAGHPESVTSAATSAVEARPNTPASGEPTINGTAQVGETLTANTSSITDADGLTNVSYTFQWLADDTEISGANASTYTLLETDEGKVIKVTVSFTDDLGNSESVTSAATDPVAAAPSSACPAPALTGGAALIWTGQLDIAKWPGNEYYGFGHNVRGALDDRTFTLGPNDYAIDHITQRDGAIGPLLFSLESGLTADEKRTLTLHACEDEKSLRLNDASERSRYQTYWWNNTGGLDWAAQTERTLHLTQDAAPPSLSTATVTDATLTLTFSEPLYETAIPAVAAFAVTVGTDNRAVSTVDVTASDVTLTLASAVSAGDTVTVDYTAPTDLAADRIQDPTGNAVVSFNGQTVTNNTPAPQN